MEQPKVNKQYCELLAQAYATTSRKEAKHLIREADKLRMQMCQQDNPYPLY